MSERTAKNRADLVFDRLRQAILSLELKPGQPVSEQEICERYAVSRTPVREALRRLSEQGLVMTVPYSGTCVSLLDMEEINQMIYMRSAVEFCVMRDFAAMATPLMYEDISHRIRMQELLIRETAFETEEFYRLDADMHSCWFRETGRLKLWDFVQVNQYAYSRYRMLDLATETDFERIILEHKELLRLMRDRDLDKLGKTLDDHLTISIKRIKNETKEKYGDYFVHF